MSACPICGASLPDDLLRTASLYPCPTCGTELKVTLNKNPFLRHIFWILPPFIDVFWLALFGWPSFKKTNLSVERAASASFEPSPERVHFETIQKSSQSGDADSQYQLGTAYENGWHVIKNDTEAMKWYRKSADQGYTDSQYALGRMYFTGSGVSRNYEEAYFWYSLAEGSGATTQALKPYLSASQIAVIEEKISCFKHQI